MEISKAQFSIIGHLLPAQRGNVKPHNLQVLCAILYAAEHDCKWRGLSAHYDNWHSIYTRANRWEKRGGTGNCFHATSRN